MAQEKLTDYQIVEGKLYNYKDKIAEIQRKKSQLKALKCGVDISISSIGYVQEKVSETNRISDPTGDAAVDRVRKIEYLKQDIAKREHELEIIEIGLESLEEVYEDVIRLFYIENLSWSEIIGQVNYKRTQCHKIRTKAIEELIPKLLGE